MGSVTLIGGSIIVGLGLITDPTGTLHSLTAIITVRGITFLAKKLTATLNKDCSEIIDFTGWCLCAGSIINLLKISTSGLVVAEQSFEKTKNIVTGIGMYFQKFADIVDKITFWD